ncbi:MAG: hypothetical protein QXV52_06860 [Nitrososphaeria archaeon]
MPFRLYKKLLKKSQPEKSNKPPLLDKLQFVPEQEAFKRVNPEGMPKPRQNFYDINFAKEGPPRMWGFGRYRMSDDEAAQLIQQFFDLNIIDLASPNKRQNFILAYSHVVTLNILAKELADEGKGEEAAIVKDFAESLRNGLNKILKSAYDLYSDTRIPENRTRILELNEHVKLAKTAADRISDLVYYYRTYLRNQLPDEEKNKHISILPAVINVYANLVAANYERIANGSNSIPVVDLIINGDYNRKVELLQPHGFARLRELESNYTVKNFLLNIIRKNPAYLDASRGDLSRFSSEFRSTLKSQQQQIEPNPENMEQQKPEEPEEKKHFPRLLHRGIGLLPGETSPHFRPSETGYRLTPSFTNRPFISYLPQYTSSAGI